MRNLEGFVRGFCLETPSLLPPPVRFSSAVIFLLTGVAVIAVCGFPCCVLALSCNNSSGVAAGKTLGAC